MAMLALRKSKANLEWPLPIKFNGAPHNPPNIPHTHIVYGIYKGKIPKKTYFIPPGLRSAREEWRRFHHPNIHTMGFLLNFVKENKGHSFWANFFLLRRPNEKPHVWLEIILNVPCSSE